MCTLFTAVLGKFPSLYPMDALSVDVMAMDMAVRVREQEQGELDPNEAVSDEVRSTRERDRQLEDEVAKLSVKQETAREVNEKLSDKNDRIKLSDRLKPDDSLTPLQHGFALVAGGGLLLSTWNSRK